MLQEEGRPRCGEQVGLPRTRHGVGPPDGSRASSGLGAHRPNTRSVEGDGPLIRRDGWGLLKPQESLPGLGWGRGGTRQWPSPPGLPVLAPEAPPPTAAQDSWLSVVCGRHPTRRDTARLLVCPDPEDHPPRTCVLCCWPLPRPAPGPSTCRALLAIWALRAACSATRPSPQGRGAPRGGRAVALAPDGRTCFRASACALVSEHVDGSHPRGHGLSRAGCLLSRSPGLSTGDASPSGCLCRVRGLEAENQLSQRLPPGCRELRRVNVNRAGHLVCARVPRGTAGGPDARAFIPLGWRTTWRLRTTHLRKHLCTVAGGGPSRCRAPAPEFSTFRSPSAGAQLPCGAWDLSRPGLEPVSPAHVPTVPYVTVCAVTDIQVMR
ncbi:unnamed protein product [Rangifer tarandus platyrhynchus]|uniref:Uncharacterized protein n=2 Tax=Rangifer tarandus platyrhynchus TaxID=3082113 RepID=A0ABN8Y4Z4_RANTA|nr:unnamed protein product [Rangifer tarandus platyrhynchus]CAI9695966.1 unnamed protein product [Rangifer tarandus platyrhynchus]